MVAKNLLNDVLALPVDERLEFFEQLRNNLLSDPSIHPLTDSERQILDEGLAEYESSSNTGSPWDEVEARLLSLIKDPA
jgi:putative addiction module component (TIGR02574 family)